MGDRSHPQCFHNAAVAQLGERLTEDQEVACSSHAGGILSSNSISLDVDNIRCFQSDLIWSETIVATNKHSLQLSSHAGGIYFFLASHAFRPFTSYYVIYLVPRTNKKIIYTNIKFGFLGLWKGRSTTMHCAKCGNIFKDDRDNCPVCGEPALSVPVLGQSESFKKLSGSPSAEGMKLVEPPPKKPASVSVGIVVAAVGVVIMLLGVIIVFVLVHLVVDGTGEDLEDWAQSGLRDDGDTSTFYLEITDETHIGFAYAYKFKDSGDAGVLSSTKLGDKGDSIILEVVWSDLYNAAEASTQYSSLLCRVPGILVILIGLAVAAVGGLISLMGYLKYKKDLANYQKQFSADMSLVEPPAPAPPPPGQEGAPPPAPPGGDGPPPPQGAPPTQPGAAPPSDQAPEPAPQEVAEPAPVAEEAPPAETPPLEESPPAEEPAPEESAEAPPAEEPGPEAAPANEEAAAETLVVACYACGGNIEVTTDERPVVLKCPGCGADAELA